MSFKFDGENTSALNPGRAFSSSLGSVSSPDSNQFHPDKSTHPSKQEKLESFSEEWVQRTVKGFAANRHSTESIGDLIAGVKSEDALKIATLTKRKTDRKVKNNVREIFPNVEEESNATSPNKDTNAETPDRMGGEGISAVEQAFTPSHATQQNSYKYKQFMSQRYAQIFHLIAIKECYNPLDIVRNRENKYQMEQDMSDPNLDDNSFNKKRGSDEFLPDISISRTCSRWGFDNSEMSSYYLQCDSIKAHKNRESISDGENVKIRRLSLSSRFSFNSEPHDSVKQSHQIKESSSLRLPKFKKTWGSGIFRRKGKQPQKKIRPSLDQDFTNVPSAQPSRRFSLDESAMSEPSTMISKTSSLTHIPDHSQPDREPLQKTRKESLAIKFSERNHNYVPVEELPTTIEPSSPSAPITLPAPTIVAASLEPSSTTTHSQNLAGKSEGSSQKPTKKASADFSNLRRSQERDTAPYFLGGLPSQSHSRQHSFAEVGKSPNLKEEQALNEKMKIKTSASTLELDSAKSQNQNQSQNQSNSEGIKNLIDIRDLPTELASLVQKYLQSPNDWSEEQLESISDTREPETAAQSASDQSVLTNINEENEFTDTPVETFSIATDEEQASNLEYYDLTASGTVSKSTVIPPAKLIEMVTAKINVAARENNSLYRKIWMDQIVDQCSQHIKYTKVNIENFERDWKKKYNTIERYINRGNKTTDDIPLNTATPTVSPIIRPRSLSSVSYKIPESSNLSPASVKSTWSSSLRLGSIFLENWAKTKVVKDECQTFEHMYTDMRQKLTGMEERIANVSNIQKKTSQDIHSNYQEVKKISEIIDHQYYHQLKLLEDQMQRILDSRSNSYLQEFFFTILSYVLAAAGYLFWIIAILFIMLKRVFSLPILSASRRRQVEAKSH
ncbi:hypothetical protein K493DRAFT_332668 [Basidiobolus meristosporus CBS 931.73]|uniref:Uncharacterized protein n=1 Tax=Basidiobolus meristosporus CBS 931.73 TaxID=1314790 RepID=A0A1Y1ZBB0_9FUNG|nr:hypothetical protein K493DRAFT_332668 [Basidiobolus meristosporus CBS 931.73]|eukprot:ORY07582.1 hypothetical protein K493DRAFT_332668 [Basidiobolus meristosporus CBS 931.73]